MKTFQIACAQGDVYFTRISKHQLPKYLKMVTSKDGQLVVAHSETGHHHTMDAASVTMFIEEANPLVCYLYVEQPTALEHLRPFDTHEPILFQPGHYKVSRQREHVPEGFRRVED